MERISRHNSMQKHINCLRTSRRLECESRASPGGQRVLWETLPAQVSVVPCTLSLPTQHACLYTPS